MDAENDNDQPNSSSASASVTPSSSNNSSSSNLLGHLPMLPFMRSTDDDDHEDDDGVNDSGMMLEESMPLQQPLSAEVSFGQVEVPESGNVLAVDASTSAGATSDVTAVPTVRAEREDNHSAVTQSSSFSSSGEALALAESRRSLPVALLSSNVNPSPSHVILSPLLFNEPRYFSAYQRQQLLEVANQDGELQQQLTLDTTPPTQPQAPSTPSQPIHLVPVPASQTLDTTLSPSPQALSFISPSSFSSSSSSSSSSHQSYNLAPHLEQIPIPSSSNSSSIPPQQQQDNQALPPQPQTSQPPSSIVASSSTAPQEQQQEQINRNNIADTIDASAIVVQPLDTRTDRPAQAAERGNLNQAAEVEAFPNDIQLDDNDNNDFDVDLNVRHDSVAAPSTSSASNRYQAPSEAPQPQQLGSSLSLDTSASGSAGTSGQNQPPTTLPLLLYQQPQQQQQHTGEPKHLPPSYDHHYHHHHHHSHNPREYHLHSQHPYQYPYDFASTLQQQKSSNGAAGTSTNSSTMFGGSSSSSFERNHGTPSTSGLEHGAGGGSGQVVDRLKLLYPNVNETETPLPRCWSPHDKCLSIGLSQNNLRVQFKGVGKQNNDAASVRTAHPIPPACGIYYFEVKIISKGKNGYMGIGLTAQQFRMNRLPGWDKQSYGYHGDDGHSFSSSGHGQSYGPTFTTGDIIGCCVNFVNNTCFYTKNGVDLGIAFRDLPTKLYPTVGLQTPGEEVDANFGQEPFKFDQIEEMMKQMRSEMKTTIYDFPLHAEQGDPTTLLQKMVNSYLVHNGYSQTAEAFSRTTGQNLREDITSIRNRQKILKLVMSGRMGQAIEQTLRSYPGLLESNKNLWFMLKCRQFIEMINGSDIEYCPSTSSSNKTTTNASTTITTTTTTSNCSVANQTSVIQSTKSYQNGNTNDAPATANAPASSCAAASSSTSSSTTTNTVTPAIVVNTTANTNYSSSSSNGSSSANNANTATAATTAASAETSNNNSCIAEPTTSATTTTTTPATAAVATNNAQNSSHITVITTDNDTKTQTNLVEHCSASGDAPATISKNNNDNDYLNDVEMENNGHSTNGNVCKNGNANNFNDSVDADEEMDVDVSPSMRKYSHGIERILEFGKDLSLMGQQLEKETKMTDDERQMLEDAFSLIAYSNPWASPLGWQLCPTKREAVCRALNSAILESLNHAKWPPLEYCVSHANELLKVMAQASLGACAFVNITDVFPKN